MKKLALFLVFVLSTAHADTPPPGTVKSRTQDGTGNPITSTVSGFSRGLDVNVISGGGGGGTVDQGNANTIGHAWPVLLTDGTHTVTVDASGYLGVNIKSLTGTLAVTQSGTWNTGRTWILSSGTDSVTVSSSALPTGAANATLQTSGNASLTSIDSKTPALGQQADAASSPVVLPADQITTLTPLSSVAVTQSTGSNLHAVVDSIPSIPAGSNAIGSVTVSNFPGTQAVTQSGTWNLNNISGTVSLPTGAATATAQATGNSSLSSIDGKTPALGQALAAGSVPVVLTAAQVTTLTPLTSVAVTQPTGSNLHTAVDSLPATPAGSNNIGSITNVTGTVSLPTGAANATLQTTGNTTLSTISGQLPATLGAHVIAASTAVNIASDQVIATASGTPTPKTVKQAAVTAGTSAIRLTNDGLAPPSTRVLLVFTLAAASTANCFFGSSSVTATGATTGNPVYAGYQYTMSSDAGDYYVICDTATQTVYIVEQE